MIYFLIKEINELDDLLKCADREAVRECIRDRKEKFVKLLEMAEKEEKYKWHDLGKNPDDSPKKTDEAYLVKLIVCDEDENGEEFEYYEYRTATYKGVKDWNSKVLGEIVAWREIEPFEGGN